MYLDLVTDLDSSTEVYLGLVETDFPLTEVYFDLGLSEAHLGAPSEVYLGLVETGLPLNDVYFDLYIVDSVRGSHLGTPSEVYLGLVETDLPLNDVYFGLYIVDSVRGPLGYPNSVVSHSALWILTWPFS